MKVGCDNTKINVSMLLFLTFIPKKKIQYNDILLTIDT